jgi:hypothetical protein
MKKPFYLSDPVSRKWGMDTDRLPILKQPILPESIENKKLRGDR